MFRNQVIKFIGAGDKVKVTIQFRGREQSRPELGYNLLQRLAEDVTDIANVEFAPKQEGRNMTMVLGPNKSAGKSKKQNVKAVKEVKEEA